MEKPKSFTPQTPKMRHQAHQSSPSDIVLVDTTELTCIQKFEMGMGLNESYIFEEEKEKSEDKYHDLSEDLKANLDENDGEGSRKGSFGVEKCKIIQNSILKLQLKILKDKDKLAEYKEIINDEKKKHSYPSLFFRKKNKSL